MIFGTSVAIVTFVFPSGERGRAIGIYVTAVYIGLSIGPFLGGVMTDLLGWRSIFFVNVPIGITTILLIRWKLKDEWAECKGDIFDLTRINYLWSRCTCRYVWFLSHPGIKRCCSDSCWNYWNADFCYI